MTGATRMRAACVAKLVGYWLLTSCSSDGGRPNGSGPAGASGSGAGEVSSTAGGGIGGSTAGSGGAVQADSALGGAGATGAAASCHAPVSEAELRELLSETGCVNMAEPGRPAAGLIPYDVNAPLWSDAALKERFLFVPEGTQVHVKDCAVEPDACKSLDEGGSAVDEGHWEFPVGSVLVKNFSLGSRRVETRLLFRLDELSWLGASYEWNDASTEATLLPGEKQRDVGGGQIWHYPSRAQCFECHTHGAGISLGPSTQQMDRDFEYASGQRNQLDQLENLGLFAAKPKAMPAYPNPSAPGELEPRARAYLQSNCSVCHRPGGTISDVDLRFSTPFADTGLCNENIQRGTGDPALPQKRLVPGHPELSSLSFRIRDLGVYRMPKIGSSLLDGQGAKLLDDWIGSLTVCP